MVTAFVGVAVHTPNGAAPPLPLLPPPTLVPPPEPPLPPERPPELAPAVPASAPALPLAPAPAVELSPAATAPVGVVLAPPAPEPAPALAAGPGPVPALGPPALGPGLAPALAPRFAPAVPPLPTLELDGSNGLEARSPQALSRTQINPQVVRPLTAEALTLGMSSTRRGTSHKTDGFLWWDATSGEAGRFQPLHTQDAPISPTRFCMCTVSFARRSQLLERRRGHVAAA